MWCVFYLVDRFLGVNISVTGWRIRGFETLHVKSPSLELVSPSTITMVVRPTAAACVQFTVIILF